jgi:hypothetical protein
MMGSVSSDKENGTIPQKMKPKEEERKQLPMLNAKNTKHAIKLEKNFFAPLANRFGRRGVERRRQTF